MGSSFTTPTGHLMPKEGDALDGYRRFQGEGVRLRDDYCYLDFIRSDGNGADLTAVRAYTLTNNFRIAARSPQDLGYLDNGLQIGIGAGGFTNYDFFVEGALPVRINSGGISLHGQNTDDRYLRKAFESPLLPFTGAAISIAHGLGVKPTFVQPVFVCVNAAGGYSVGDEIHATQFEKDYSNSAGFSTWANDSTVGFSWRNGPFLTATKAGGSTYDPAAADWNLKLRAFV